MVHPFHRLTAHVTLVAFVVTTLTPATSWAQNQSALPAIAPVERAPAEESHESRAPIGVSANVQDVPRAIDDRRFDAQELLRRSKRSEPEGGLLRPGERAIANDVPRSITQEVWDGARSSKGDSTTEQDSATPETDSTALEFQLGTEGGGSQVSSHSNALPSGGAISGLGESFSAQLTTGGFSYSIPLELPPARASVSAHLALSYGSSSGSGNIGVGWALGIPAISRQTDRTLPSYLDPADNIWYPGQDRFVFGGAELVPICTIVAGACSAGGGPSDEHFPAWSNGWQYFRARVDSFQRVFWSPDHRTWRVQGKDGTYLELGVPLDGSGYTGALEFNPDRPSEIYRWYVARGYDSHGDVERIDPRPVNVVVYRYIRDGETVYLSDTFDTSPAATPTTSALEMYSNHARLEYEQRPDPTISFRAGFRQDLRLRLRRVGVSAKPFSGSTSSARELVRRYWLEYDDDSHHSLLMSVSVEGRCSSPIAEGTDQALPASNCPRLPSTTLEYQRVEGPSNSRLFDSRGRSFEAFNTRLRSLGNSPAYSLGEAQTELMDVNRDGLLDVVVTDPGRFEGSHGVFLNGRTSDGTSDTLGFFPAIPMGVTGVDNVDAAVLSFKNPNVIPLDADGDGVTDLVHMPQKKVLSIFSPVPRPSGLVWEGRGIGIRDGQSPKIDFTRDAARTNVMDVNSDGLVDVVVAAATGYQTFFSLGRFPGGDGQFGSGKMTGPESAALSSEPALACAPYASAPVLFGNAGIVTTDMNGDGFVDVALLRSGAIQYWPGRGNGFWGTGARDDCKAGAFAEGRQIVMNASPRFGTASNSPLLGDVNADGLPDLVEIRNDSVDIYLNENGVGWTERYTITETPHGLSGRTNARIVDINGSGTPDVLWGDGHEYRYIDLTGGVRPFALKRIHNGLGKTVELDFETSAQRMLAAGTRGEPWLTTMPFNVSVIRRMTVRDNLELVGRPAGRYVTEYDYRDPVYEGRQRDFRGFREAFTITPGVDPTQSTTARSLFNLGECTNAVSIPGVLDPCAPSERWRDLGLEPLHGTPRVSEVRDGRGVYLSTVHQGYELRRLYMGSDGRSVAAAFPVRAHKLSYDTANPGAFAQSSAVSLPDLSVDRGASFLTFEVPLRAEAGTVVTRSEMDFDDFGNIVQYRDYGCVAGCLFGADEVLTTTTVFDWNRQNGSGWLWGAISDQFLGAAHPDRVTNDRREYNAAGDVIRSFSVLSGGVTLNRTHATGALIAPNPPGMSAGVTAPVEIQVSTIEIDQFGTHRGTRTPNGRCSEEILDAEYAVFPVEIRTYVGAAGTNGCGARALVSRGTFDRGTGALTSSVGITGQPERIGYDGFGRVVSVTRVDPNNPGQLASHPSSIIEYRPSPDPTIVPFSYVYTQIYDGTTTADARYQEQYAYVDGLGRTLALYSEADESAGDSGDWIVSGVSAFDSRGRAIREHGPWFSTGDDLDLGAAPPTPAVTRDVDAFGRTVTEYDIDGTVLAHFKFHAASVDAYDAADLAPGARQGTHTTTHLDGRARSRLEIVRTRTDGVNLRELRLKKAYLPTGEVESVTREGDGEPSVIRWMRYDTFGRLVLNVEPNTSPDFSMDPATPPANIRAFRYAYNDSGDLVGTSDARGCGANYHYDAGGRLTVVDYSPCEAPQPAYTAPNLSTGAGSEAFFRYDTTDPDAVTAPDGTAFTVPAQFLNGRLASVADRGRKVIYRYDARGRDTGTAVRLVKPGAPASALTSRYAPRWYVKTATYDGSDRLATASTGNAVPALNGTAGQSNVTYSYTARGALRKLDSSYGVLIASQTLTADGRMRSQTLGDGASTQRSFDYDARNRLAHAMTYRGSAPVWSSPPTGYTPGGSSVSTQLLLEDSDIVYDSVNNVTAVIDHRLLGDWPAGAKPVTRRFHSDDLYRVKRITYEYPSPGMRDTWQSPFAAEVASATREPRPSPHVSLTDRVLEQTYEYDGRGNITSSTDDAGAFYDRSLGTQAHGSPLSGPDQLQHATNRSTTTGTRRGELDAQYDAAGNLNALVVQRDGPCLPSSASCWQRFLYRWDELGRLSSASRWDLTASERAANASLAQPAPARTADVVLEYVYSNSGQRVLKRVVRGSTQLHTAYVFSTFELRGTTYGTDYALSASAANVYVGGIGRLAFFQDNLAAISVGGPRLVLNVPDYLGSGSISIDHQTGELIERVTYQGYGARESDYRPSRWGEYRDPYGLTGKEDDVEVGLVYFGSRYYAPGLGRWISPDPITIHALGSDLNPYAYLSGRVSSALDPDGNELVTFLIIVGAAAAISMAANAVSQAKAANWDWGAVELGWAGGNGMLAAGVVGATSAAVSFFAAPVMGAALGGALGGGVAGGLGATFRGEGAKGIASGIGYGAATALAGAGAGAYLNGAGANGFAQALGGGAAGTLTGVVLSGGDVTLGDAGFALAMGVAASGAGYAAAKATQARQAEQKAEQQSKRTGQAASQAANAASKGAGPAPAAAAKEHPKFPAPEDRNTDAVQRTVPKSAAKVSTVGVKNRNEHEIQMEFRRKDPNCGSSPACAAEFNATIKAQRSGAPGRISGIEPPRSVGAMTKYKPTQPAREFSKDKILEYRDQMLGTREPKWNWSEDKIVIDPEGNIIGGHHRVVAADLAGVEIPESAIHRTTTVTDKPVYRWRDIFEW